MCDKLPPKYLNDVRLALFGVGPLEIIPDPCLRCNGGHYNLGGKQ